jgi:hypothetical protein
MQSNLNTPKLSTDELAALGKVVPQSIRAAVCRNGHWLGMRPVKLANRRLLWDAAEAARVLNGGVA